MLHKNCIFLSDSNIELMTNIRACSLRFGVELSPCRQVMEMLELYQKGTNAVLVEQTERFINIKNYVSVQNFSNFFYLQNEKVFDIKNKLRYKNLESFFKSKIFKHKIKNIINANDKITQRLTELGVVFNTWNSRCIKLILEQMAKQNKHKVSHQILKCVAINTGNNLKGLCDNLRPTLKLYTINLNNKTQIKNNTNKFCNMVNLLYKYCFN